MPWRNGLDREELLAVHIWQMERKEEVLVKVTERIREYREKAKDYVDVKHVCQTQLLMERDWVLMWNLCIEKQYQADQKFEQKWLGPYVVKQVFCESRTYGLRELDGMHLPSSR